MAYAAFEENQAEMTQVDFDLNEFNEFIYTTMEAHMKRYDLGDKPFNVHDMVALMLHVISSYAVVHEDMFKEDYRGYVRHKLEEVFKTHFE